MTIRSTRALRSAAAGQRGRFAFSRSRQCSLANSASPGCRFFARSAGQRASAGKTWEIKCEPGRVIGPRRSRNSSTSVTERCIQVDIAPFRYPTGLKNEMNEFLKASSTIAKNSRARRHIANNFNGTKDQTIGKANYGEQTTAPRLRNKDDPVNCTCHCFFVTCVSI